MKKLVMLLSTGIMCLGLSACAGAEFDTGAIENMSKTIEDVSSTVNDMQSYIGEIQSAVQEGIDNTNAAMEWYKTEAWADNPWISTPITEDQVENIIEAGQKEINSYIGENATYDILREDDIAYFNDLFNSPDSNGFLLSTYEKPEGCNAYEVLKRDSEIIKPLDIEEKDKKGASELVGRISAEDINDVLFAHLGLENSDLKEPAKLSKNSGEEYLYLDEQLECRKVACNGGFYYNDLYIVMMQEEGSDAPFSLTALTKLDDGTIRIHMNYRSDDMAEVDWDGSFLYDLYDLMQDSDLKNIISVPGFDGEISLGTVMDKASAMGVSGEDALKAAKLISDVKDNAKTYVQEFDDYSVYYSNLNPNDVGEFIVSQIDITSDNYKTAEGIGLGATIDDLKETYGEGVTAGYLRGKKQLMYEKGKYNMLFTIGKTGEVEEMSLFLADDEPKAEEESEAAEE